MVLPGADTEVALTRPAYHFHGEMGSSGLLVGHWGRHCWPWLQSLPP